MSEYAIAATQHGEHGTTSIFLTRADLPGAVALTSRLTGEAAASIFERAWGLTVGDELTIPLPGGAADGILTRGITIKAVAV
jgi:hypothetical protein